jgi:hypothetical protein
LINDGASQDERLASMSVTSSPRRTLHGWIAVSSAVVGE